MAPTLLDFDLGRGHARLAKLHSLLDNTAERDRGVLRVAANVVDGERVTIGTDVFEIDIINSNPTAGAETVSALLNNSTDASVTFSGVHGLVVGDLFRVDNEILRVKTVTSTTVVEAQRARCGTAAAAHNAATSVLVSNTPGVVIAAGRIPVGLVVTLTPTVFTAALADEINSDAGASLQSASCRAIVIDVNTVLLVRDGPGTFALATTETLGGGGNAWDAATMSGGIAASRRRILTGTRVPIAAEVTKGELYIPLDFAGAATSVTVSVRVTATGVEKVWDGATTIVAPSGSDPGYVKLDNSGGTDWAVTDTIHYVIAE